MQISRMLTNLTPHCLYSPPSALKSWHTALHNPQHPRPSLSLPLTCVHGNSRRAAPGTSLSIMVWFTSLIHRLYVSACLVVHPSSRRAPTTHCTPVSVLSVVDEPPQEEPQPAVVAHSVAPQPAKHEPRLKLLTLPDDVLSEIVRHVTHSDHNSPAQGSMSVVEERTYTASVALTETCRQLAYYFYNSLDNVCLSTPKVDDEVLERLVCKAAPVLQRLVLRGCTRITNHGLEALARHATVLRSLDLSFVDSVSDHGIQVLCNATAPRLRKLLLRKCVNVGDAALEAIAKCKRIETLDLSYCAKITDRGIRYIAMGCGDSLKLLAVSHDVLLTDASFQAIGMRCRNLIQFCARGLPAVSDIGFNELCRGLGENIEGIDITDCRSLTRDPTLNALRTYCGKIYAHVMPRIACKPLRQIIVSTLRQNIFIVHGSDPSSRKDTVHTVLIDNGDIVSASLLSSGTTDLSMLGIVLCKSYGSGLDENTKRMLEDDYGIPTCSLTD